MWFVLALLLAGGVLADTSLAASQSEPIKSPVDRKTYRALELDNGLKVLLVSDPDSDKSAASLDVHVGNGSDPSEWQGLAHFLEHMLFLGTKKYPDAGEYKKFIDDHGGSNNAYTSFDHTNYYFDISSEYLEPALDRFSRFFIDPTFEEIFVERERAVVHSEYQARLKDESRRVWAARRQLLDRDHPGSRFAVGSEHTLRTRDGINVRQKLIEFYNQHYSANIMTLTVVGKQSLDQLEQWVIPRFDKIPNRNAEVQLFEQPYLNPKLLASRQNVLPQKDELRVEFLFPIPSSEAYYRSKPLGYVANLIGHEGEGSLLALLKSLGWAEGLSAGAGFMDEVQGVFQVSIQLSQPGLQHIDDIGALLFQYIELIEREGVETWRYDEERKLAEIAFRFAEDHGAGASARFLAASLHRYPIEDVLRGAYMMERYRPALITYLLSRLRADNVLVQVVSRDVKAGDNKKFLKTPFYDVEYDVEPIPTATIERWNNARQQNAHDKRLALPLPNRFIPERLTAQPLANAQTIPTRLNDKTLDAWYHGDAQFDTPRAAFYFNIRSPIANNSARNLVLAELFVRLVNKQLDKATYPARLAGLKYNLYRHGRGFSVRISGYEDKQPALLKAVLETLFTPNFDAAELALIVAELKREWSNVLLDSPSNQTVHELYRLLMHPYWSESERLAVLSRIERGKITTEQLIAYANALLERVQITSLSHGDVTRERALEMNAMLRTAFAESKLIDTVERPRVRVLDEAHTYLRSMNVKHDDSALVEYFQGHEKSDTEKAKMLLLGQLIEAPFFFNMRTTNRVGYLVYGTYLNILDVPGLLLSVQSPTHTSIQIAQLYDKFLDEFEQILTRMNASDFAQVKSGLIARILTRDKKLTDRSNRYWGEIDQKKFTFDSRQRLSALIESLDKDDILTYYQLVRKTRPRKLLVQSSGRRQAAAKQKLRGKQYTRVRGAIGFRKSARTFFPEY